MPQLVALMVVSTQLPSLHRDAAPEQPVAHAYVLPEAAQTGILVGHELVQPPHVLTLERSVSQPSSALLVQCPYGWAHEVVGTTHLPATQVTGPLTLESSVQSCPHAPQLCGSSTAHPPLQLKPGQASAVDASTIASTDASRCVPPFPPDPWLPPAPELPPDALASCPAAPAPPAVPA
jgi:hypothetical protein